MGVSLLLFAAMLVGVLVADRDVVAPYEGGDRRAIAELPGLREAFAASRPLFVDDMRQRATGMAQATADILGTGSLLNVPVAVGGITQLSLVLTWTEILPPLGQA